MGRLLSAKCHIVDRELYSIEVGTSIGHDIGMKVGVYISVAMLSVVVYTAI